MNLIDVARDLNTQEKCLAYLENYRWPAGVRCPTCGNAKLTKYQKKGKTGKSQQIYQCLEKTCQIQFSATTGTLFHDSHLPLPKWFMAIALVTDAKKGISSNQLKRHLKVSYKTAWYLAHRIREAMQQDKSLKFSGVVEVDETYVGGRYDHRRKRLPHEKPSVMGIIERGGKVIASHIPTPSKIVLTGKIKDHVLPDAEMIVTDQYVAYKSLGEAFRHKVINHIREYVRGNVHTNTIENFWSLFKRGVIGSFHNVSVKHLPRYLDEFTYRFNNRKDVDLFGATVKNLLTGSALPYCKLIAEPITE
jgi:transposase-like protein